MPYLAAMSYRVSPNATVWTMGVAVADGAGVKVSVDVAVGLGDAVGVSVAVGVALDVGVAVLVGVGERVCVGVQLGVGIGLGVRVLVGMGVCRGVTDGVGVEVNTSTGVAVTPLVTRPMDIVTCGWDWPGWRNRTAATRTSTTPARIETAMSTGRIQ